MLIVGTKIFCNPYSSTACESALQKMLCPGTKFSNDAASLHLAGIERKLIKEDDKIFDSRSQYGTHR
jgi:hypothetical protein